MYNLTGTLASRTQATGSTPYALSWAHDIRDRVKTMTHPRGMQATYTYGTEGRQKSVTARSWIEPNCPADSQ